MKRTLSAYKANQSKAKRNMNMCVRANIGTCIEMTYLQQKVKSIDQQQAHWESTEKAEKVKHNKQKNQSRIHGTSAAAEYIRCENKKRPRGFPKCDLTISWSWRTSVWLPTLIPQASFVA